MDADVVRIRCRSPAAASSRSSSSSLSSLLSDSLDSCDSFDLYSSSTSSAPSSVASKQSPPAALSPVRVPPHADSPDAMASPRTETATAASDGAASPLDLEVTRDRVSRLSLDGTRTGDSPSPPSAPADSQPGAPQGAPAPPDGVQASSPSSSSSAAPSPSSAAASPSLSPSAQPPPLYPRASAPAAPSGAGARRPPGGGALKAGVRGAVGGAGGPLKMPPSLAAKMAAMTSRSSTSGNPIPTLRTSNAASASSSSASSTAPAHRPPPRPPTAPGSAPVLGARPGVTGPLSGAGARAPSGMAARRRGPGAGLTLSQMGASADEASPFGSPAVASPAPGAGAGGTPRTGMAARRGVGMRLPGSDAGGAGADAGVTGGGQGWDDEPTSPSQSRSPGQGGTPFSNFRKIVDPSGRLNFAQKAIVHADGVDFSSGASFKIKMDDFELFEELGKGNYGTVQKVLHRPTGVTMALKEIRLELDDSKLKTIITELDILHRATSRWIIDFYGAFFIESCVYLCMQYMNAGSLDFLAGCDIPELVLARITKSIVAGLKFLKDELHIMHRDVKPTNVLLNTDGQVKLCDFGVSGQLDRSLAKTNIGCQSYMAPERIKGESQGAVISYSAASDIWSLGLTVIETAVGHYPYPPETYSNVFAQLTAIVHGDAPTLPDSYSDAAHDFVESCLQKDAARRPTYQQLLDSEWLRADDKREVDMAGWVAKSLEYRKTHPKISVPALA